METQFRTISHFRELGGWKTADGRTIRHNLIYRCGELSHISDEELEKLNSLNIKTVYDLRSTEEQKGFPDRTGNYKIVLCPLAKPSIKTDVKYKNPASFIDRMKNADENYYNYSRISFAKGYLEFCYNTETIGKVIESLDRHETFLYHCFGGKDRTGTISMLIMLFLGCDYQTCKEHYMYHKIMTAQEEAEYVKRLEKNEVSDWGIKLGKYYFQVSEELFDCAYYSIFDVYNTIEDYLEDQFGIGKDQIADWKNFYLE